MSTHGPAKDLTSAATLDDPPPNQSRPAAVPKEKPVIRISGDLAAMADEAWNALVRANDPPILFQQATGIVRVVDSGDGAPVIQLVSVDRLRHRLARVALWRKARVNRGDRPEHPLLDVVRDLLAEPAPPLPLLRHLT